MADQTLVEDGNAEVSLYLRAIGYWYRHQETIHLKRKAVEVTTWRYMPPDTQACITWLKTHCPDRWR